MSVQYVSDSTGQTTAVLISIDDWDKLRKKHPDVDEMEGEIPQWQKDLIEERMLFLKQHPDQVTSIVDFLTELDKEDEEIWDDAASSMGDAHRYYTSRRISLCNDKRASPIGLK